MTNGYFQLVTGDRSTKIRIVPPQDGGEMVDGREIISYLKQRGISYDISAINEAAQISDAQEKLVEINKITCMREREGYSSVTAQDGMSYTVRFYPASVGTAGNGEQMTEEEFLNDLKHCGIVYGINNGDIKAFFANRRYCTDIIAARGIEPRQGQDGYIEYKFDTDGTAKPTLLPDGSVDFFHLHILQVCGKGQTLAVMHPEDKGESGYDIKGNIIKQAEVKEVSFSCGRNVEISEDRTKLISTVDGHVSIVCGSVEVSDVLNMKDIGVSTGNVDYEGNIEIDGNVDSGFTVHATGDINIKGVVGSSTIISGGNVLIARGMNGVGKGSIRAEGNVISKFLENVTVSAGGYVSSESVIQCDISAAGEVNVDGRRGSISGGTVSAGTSVSAKSIGSDMGTATTIEVGVDPGLKSRLAEIQKTIIEDRKQIETLEPVLISFKQKMASGVKMSPDQAIKVKTIAQVFLQKKTENEKLSAELDLLQGKLKNSKDAFVAVHDSAYPGVKIIIGDISMNVKKPAQFCRFISDGGDVRISGY